MFNNMFLYIRRNKSGFPWIFTEEKIVTDGFPWFLGMEAKDCYPWDLKS